MKKINLKIDNLAVKEGYFNFLKKMVKIPACKNCGKLFDLGFPNNERGLADNLICHENELICSCEYFKIVKNIYNAKKEGLVNINFYYDV